MTEIAKDIMTEAVTEAATDHCSAGSDSCHDCSDTGHHHDSNDICHDCHDSDKHGMVY